VTPAAVSRLAPSQTRRASVAPEKSASLLVGLTNNVMVLLKALFRRFGLSSPPFGRRRSITGTRIWIFLDLERLFESLSSWPMEGCGGGGGVVVCGGGGWGVWCPWGGGGWLGGGVGGGGGRRDIFCRCRCLRRFLSPRKLQTAPHQTAMKSVRHLSCAKTSVSTSSAVTWTQRQSKSAVVQLGRHS